MQCYRARFSASSARVLVTLLVLTAMCTLSSSLHYYTLTDAYETPTSSDVDLITRIIEEASTIHSDSTSLDDFLRSISKASDDAFASESTNISTISESNFLQSNPEILHSLNDFWRLTKAQQGGNGAADLQTILVVFMKRYLKQRIGSSDALSPVMIEKYAQDFIHKIADSYSESTLQFYHERMQATQSQPLSLSADDLKMNVLLCSGIPHAQSSYFMNVDPMIGTAGGGFGVAALNPGAQTPFGMARVGPDSSTGDFYLPWRHFGGYSYCDTHVRAFSHTHLVGAGAMDYGNIGVMPSFGATGERVRCRNVLPLKLKGDYMRSCNFKMLNNHGAEHVEPGYYTTQLLNETTSASITAETTATTNVGIHRYTWHNNNVTSATSSERVVFVDVCHMISTNDGRCGDNTSISIDYENQRVSGYLHSNGEFASRSGGFMLYFVADFNTSFSSSNSGLWRNATLYPHIQNLQMGEVGAYISFPSSTNAVEMAVAISFISIEQASDNMKAQITQPFSFDAVREATQSLWKSKLGVISTTGGTAADQRKFATAMYHSMLAPTQFSEANGMYMGFGKKVEQKLAGKYYSDLSIWDVMRTHYPLLVLLQPDVAADVAESMILQGLAQGILPEWSLADGDTHSMIGIHSVVMLTDAILAGAMSSSGLNETLALEMSAASTRKAEGDDYTKLGYKPDRPCQTLAFALDDACVANLASHLNRPDIHAEFSATANNWQNNWYPDQQFFCPRDANGTWHDCNSKWFGLMQLWPFDKYYREGDAWHWRWSVQANLSGLVDTFSSVESFVTELTEFFENGKKTKSNFMPNSYYWAGNEEDIHAAYAFISAQRPDLTQEYVRWVMDNRYTTNTDGIAGNDDYGTLSAWYVFNAIGLYPNLCQGNYMVGSPVFDTATIHRSTGDISIVAHNNSPTNVYVSKILINGVALPVSAPFVDQQKLFQGGAATIELFMAAQPPQ
jgi:predicted alpha-1,2-mannosidase